MRDLTQGSPAKQILFFTIPLVIGNLFQQLYNFSDTLIVGQTLGVKALAAVGATGSIMFLILGFVQGFTAGLSIITAQRYGARDIAGVRKSMASTLLVSGITTVVVTITSLVIVYPLLKLMQTPAEILNQAFVFIAIILAGIFATMGYNVTANALRAVGDSRSPLIYLIIGMVANIILELWFILGLKLGVGGAALATVLAQLISTVFSFWHIYKYSPLLQVTRSDLKWDSKDIRIHLHAGLPMGFQSSIIAIGALVLQGALNTLGTDAVAATTAAQRIDQVATLPLMSFGITMATFAAQNYGARQFDRILIGVKQALVMSMGFGLFMGIIEILFGDLAVMLFVGSGQHEVLNLAQQYFWANGAFYYILSALFIIRYVLQGLNDAKTPTYAGIAELIMRTVAAVVLVGPFGFFGASLANVLAWVGSLVVMIPAYRKIVKNLKQQTKIIISEQ
ncbi:MATE family efflux transporter [Leuconostoc pseudomesenteroides]|jgi:putative MATE family efflux protein|uniref:MATE family efflux transporter n=2 Tax=Leuconostoc TaxID=1243 RepID=A0A1X0VF38_LEUPS|nr:MULTISPECIES: MATE family efflux transporter [Leuconostoc]MCT4377593.1 MATE family efflux transporter [Leuconostoc falkenbergense]MCT4410157.1 MATE family efflux transporter [Leuconostoc falkenbergense]MCT4419376.1 MATE family efflux transporter [Leuconostoc falkenbergense]MCX7579577.1 MATE family efflux transporter [Leuconostoc falkenbergense]MDV3545482.1 MATE family efflux transporter [Leuconostoc falkenbergense]